ncbi:MAG: hypothetical protein RMM98_17045 [Acidobacteriota bacterium]|nr:hypothetical protein [Blastocatellia bacterium]MDW8241310.1 hypothetical protein [Acidobacteriota bacterium]
MVASDRIGHALTGLTLTGVEEAVRALNERRVQRLVVCGKLHPPIGWQCQGCLAVYFTRQKQCQYCRSTNIRQGDLKSVIIARAYRLGCAIEIKSRCPELEQLGGVGVLLDERCANHA